jgi:hypothetical protein
MKVYKFLIDAYMFQGRRINEEFKKIILRRLKLNPDTFVGEQVGNESSYGKVFKMANNKVLKVIGLPEDFRPDFINEIRIGRIPGIEKVGTRIYEATYRTFKLKEGEFYLGAYVMDDLISENGNRAMNLKSYYGVRNKCPVLTERDAEMFVKLLFDFYKITKGYHGDLHTGNIQAILRADGSLKQLKIIDYGTHTKFKTNINSLKCLDDILNVIQSEFNTLQGNTPRWSKKPHIVEKTPGNNGRTQKLVSNTALLRNKNIHPMFPNSGTKRRRVNSPPRHPQ